MRKIILALTLLIVTIAVNAQKPAFYNEIQQFKKKDSVQLPPKNAVLLIGSSTFTKWTDVQNYFPKHSIVNRGFGGSSLPDVIRYVGDVVYPYQPKQVVIYCGENDFTAGKQITAQLVADRAKKLMDTIRHKYPKVPIAFISIKPSPSRIELQPRIKEANQLIKQMVAGMKHTQFIDIYDSMLNQDGTMMQEIFLSDNLHMNAKGYAIWQKIMEPYLK